MKIRLLKTEEMARFVSDGFLVYESIIPKNINDLFIKEYINNKSDANLLIPHLPPGVHFNKCNFGEIIASVLSHPIISGAIHSLVGENPIFDHHHIHIAEPNNTNSQHNHQDSTIDPRENVFDIQLLYFPHEVKDNMGGTRYIPGTHLRRVHESQIARYQNMKGQKRVTCPSGTVIIFHHGIWHGAGSNQSSIKRIMYKIRLQPAIKQIKLWDTSDINPKRIKHWNRPIFHGNPDKNNDPIPKILMKSQKWFDNEERLEFINRVRLWRELIGDKKVDIDYWLTRLGIF